MMRASMNKVANAWIATAIALACSLVACGDDFDAACAPWCSVVEECSEMSFTDCMNGCAEESSQARAISSECAHAVRDQNLCLGGLGCAQLEAWLEEVPPDDYPCKATDDAVDAACAR